MHRFGKFEFDAESSELRRNGMLVKLAAQPAGILRLLVEAHGEIVSREAIRQAVWGDDTHVDFDRGLTVAIAQIRSALGDSAESPRFIQTVPRRGYRFLVETAPEPPRRRRWLLAAALCAVLIAAVLAALSIGRNDGKIVAVLSFQALDADVPAALSTAITEELINALGQSGVANLSVLARGSTAKLSFDDARTRVAADYIVEGSVRRYEGGLRVNARLAEAASAKTLWSRTVERADTAGFDETAAAEIAAGIAAHLGGKPATVADRDHSCGADWEQLRTARALLLAPSREDLNRAIEILEPLPCRAARTALADAILHRGRIGRRDDAGMARAAELARKVLAQAPADPEANNALAGALFWKDWRFGEAKTYYERALRQNPSYAAAHHDYAWLLVATGETGEAVNHLRRAVALDPLSPRINIDAGWLYLQAHRFREAAVQAERARQLDVSEQEAEACRDRALYYLGERPHPANPPPGGAYGRAQHHVWLNQAEQALAALEESYAARDLMFPFLGSDPAFRPLRGNARFEALKAKLRVL
jgi:DNA-binding winged helix-turn-helix (wHTH) protein/TolB-like protein/Tfp pilus assembly protein PilF